MEKEEKLREIAAKVFSCKRCPLYKTATNPVPGNGDANAEIMLAGEAPGYWEDQKGIPFCGPAGKLLDELLESINLKRTEVFVTNILRHRPPNNRDPLPEEIEACKCYLDEQILTIAPKAIVTLGRFSMAKFLPFAKISKDHGVGRVIVFNDRRLIIIPMFHPAAALRSASVEQELRKDFLNIFNEIDRLANPLKVENDSQLQENKQQDKEQLILI